MVKFFKNCRKLPRQKSHILSSLLERSTNLTRAEQHHNSDFVEGSHWNENNNRYHSKKSKELIIMENYKEYN